MIGESDEVGGQATDAALQADGLFPLLLELEVDVYRAIFVVALDFRGLVRFDLVEIIKLIEAQDAEFPQALVEELAFVNHQLAPDDFVARGGVAAKVDTTDKILLLLVELERQIDDFLCFVDVHLRLRREVDKSIFAVDLAVLLEGFADLFGGEDVAFFERESALEGVDLERQGLVRISADDLQRPHVVAFALLDGNGNVDGLAVAFSGYERDAEAGVRGVNVLKNGFANDHFEVAVVAIQAADTDFQIFAQLFAVIGLREYRDIPEVERNRVGPVVPHGSN